MNERQQLILDTAQKLFSEKGYAATGLREIAEKAGISIGNIYNYFKNKEELFHRLLDPRIILDSMSDLPDIVQGGFPENMHELIMHFKQIIDDNFDLYRLIFIDLIEFHGANTNRILESVIELGRSVFFETLVEEPEKTGLKKLDYDLGIKLFVSAGASMFIINNILPSASFKNYSDEEVSSIISSILLHGIAK